MRLESAHGTLRISHSPRNAPPDSEWLNFWLSGHQPIKRTLPIDGRQSILQTLGFQWFGRGQYFTIFLPYWLLSLAIGMIAALAALPWIRWRFSLRALLIATMLVAVALGILVTVI